MDSNYPSINLINGTVVMKSKKKPPFKYAKAVSFKSSECGLSASKSLTKNLKHVSSENMMMKNLST